MGGVFMETAAKLHAEILVETENLSYQQWPIDLESGRLLFIEEVMTKCLKEQNS